MALFTIHPDYMYFGSKQSKPENYPVERYIEFLTYIKNTYDGQYWNVLARDMARYWGKEIGPGARIQSMNFKKSVRVSRAGPRKSNAGLSP